MCVHMRGIDILFIVSNITAGMPKLTMTYSAISLYKTEHLYVPFKGNSPTLVLGAHLNMERAIKRYNLYYPCLENSI